ncbi:predicted protein [Naegleria gruberi]|uniref:Predicted protein n=1 Tax=Naegleria gruberi TaxID=5762 RepID=D2VWW4_NAEGR|nr:uncharacterized protein NAEGRDRAFT_73527 [Naegleria gruberi]EFC38698.1 predicted protein [Naegleria gruberi]|eukprot:XP_002671442.1 predicted protein [Naegleria gruberi strain NEG-M]
MRQQTENSKKKYSKFSIIEFASSTSSLKKENHKVSNTNSSTLEHLPKKRGRPTKNTTTKSNKTCMFIKSTETIHAYHLPRYHPYMRVNTKLNQTNSSLVNNVNCKDSSSCSSRSSSPPTTHLNSHTTNTNCNSVIYKQRIVRTSISIRELLN